MSIKLDWTLPVGQTVDSVVIYRALSPISIGALPTPLATLPGSAVSYEDTTPVLGKIYYYLVSLVAGSNVSYSSNYEVGHLSTTGPGPQEIMRGNWKRGYFGMVPDEEMFSWNDIKTQLGLVTNPQTSNPGGWFKLAYEGKVLFWPFTYYASGASFKEIYDRGAAMGENGVGTFPPGWNMASFTVNQNKKISRDGFEFLARLPKPKDPTKVYTTFASFAGTELDELILALDGQANDSYTAGLEPLYDGITSTVVQCLTAAPYSTTLLLTLTNTGNIGSVNSMGATTYRPLLELIP